MNPIFSFTSELWLWDAKSDSTWIFVSLPLDESEEIKDLIPHRAGFGSVKVQVRIGDIEWKTSIFPDSKSGCYVLPLKKAVRNKAKIDVGDTAKFELEVLIT